MKKMKFLKIILTILILITILFTAFYLYNININSTTTESNNSSQKNQDTFKIEKIPLDPCKQKNNDQCSKYKNDTLRHLTLNKSYPKLNDEIQKINSLVDEKYNDAIQSNLNSSECLNVKNIFNYRNIYIMSEIIYESDHLIGISYEIYGTDICTKKALSPSFNSYVYNIDEDKFLTQQEVLDLYKITDEDISKAIQENISYWNQLSSTNYTQEDFDTNYKLSISYDGNLEITYLNKVTNTTHNTTIKQTNIN